MFAGPAGLNWLACSLRMPTSACDSRPAVQVNCGGSGQGAQHQDCDRFHIENVR